jgi:ribosomal protein L31
MSLLTRSLAPLSRATVSTSRSATTILLRHKSSSTSSTATSTDYVTRTPELFDQTIVLSNGATFTLRTPSPRPQIRLTRDTRNHPLWNPEMRGNTSSDDSGQLSRFAKKFGDMDGFGDLEFADGGDVDRKALTAKQIAQAAPPSSGKGGKKKK